MKLNHTLFKALVYTYWIMHYVLSIFSWFFVIFTRLIWYSGEISANSLPCMMSLKKKSNTALDWIVNLRSISEWYLILSYPLSNNANRYLAGIQGHFKHCCISGKSLVELMMVRTQICNFLQKCTELLRAGKKSFYNCRGRIFLLDSLIVKSAHFLNLTDIRLSTNVYTTFFKSN